MPSVFNNPTKWFAKSENDLLVVEGGDLALDLVGGALQVGQRGRGADDDRG